MRAAAGWLFATICLSVWAALVALLIASGIVLYLTVILTALFVRKPSPKWRVSEPAAAVS
jgi:hypothetical protein